MDGQSSSTSTVNDSLQKIAKGTIVVFIGAILVAILTFTGKVLIARNFTQAEYGIFSLGFTLLSIFVSIGCLGLQDGVTRQVSYYLGKKEFQNVRSVALYSLLFGIISGIILFLVVFFYSDFISIKLFNLPELSFALRIFSVAIPFFILILVLTAIFRGLFSVKEKVIFEDSLRNLFFILLLLIVILGGFCFI